MNRICSKCGDIIVDDEAVFCPKCGNKCYSTNKWICSCGNENEFDAQYCTSCGTSRTSLEPAIVMLKSKSKNVVMFFARLFAVLLIGIILFYILGNHHYWYYPKEKILCNIAEAVGFSLIAWIGVQGVIAVLISYGKISKRYFSLSYIATFAVPYLYLMVFNSSTDRLIKSCSPFFECLSVVSFIYMSILLCKGIAFAFRKLTNH